MTDTDLKGTPVVIAFMDEADERRVIDTQMTAWFDIERGEIVIPFLDADGALIALGLLAERVRVEAHE